MSEGTSWPPGCVSRLQNELVGGWFHVHKHALLRDFLGLPLVCSESSLLNPSLPHSPSPSCTPPWVLGTYLLLVVLPSPDHFYSEVLRGKGPSSFLHSLPKGKGSHSCQPLIGGGSLASDPTTNLRIYNISCHKSLYVTGCLDVFESSCS